MKKISILPAILLVFLFAGCQGNESNAGATPEAVGKTETAVAEPSSASDSSPLTSSDDGLDLVFQGGGSKGLAHIGAIREFERQQRPYRRLVGASAGSIVAVLLAAGYSADEIEAAITERLPDGNIITGSFLVPPEKREFDADQLRNSITYRTLQDIIPEFVPEMVAEQIDLEVLMRMLDETYYREIFALVETGGVYSGDRYVAWLEEQLNKDGRSLGSATLAQFHEETGADLTIAATDADDRVMLMLNHRTAPDLPVVWAIRMSSSIPFVFQEVEWQPEWGAYQGNDISGHLVIDGGATTNLPLELVLSQEPEILAAMALEPAPEQVIGLVLDHDRPIPGLESTPVPSVTPDVDTLENEQIANRWLEIKARNINLVDTLLNAHDHLVANTYPEHVCYLPVGGVETLEYDMSDEKIELLLAAAQAETEVCLAKMGD